MITFFLKPVPPFRLDLTAWTLRRLPINSIDRWDGRRYSRTLVIDGKPLEISIEQTGPVLQPELRVTLDGPSKDKAAVSSVLHKTLGLNIDLSGFYDMASRHKKLNALVKRFAGVKPPRFPSVFEAVVNGFACQQLSLFASIHLLNRISTGYGAAHGDHHAFPKPEDLAKARPHGLRKLGYSSRKAENIISLAKTVCRGDLDLESLEDVENGEAMTRLLELPGVGRWTAEYVMLRGLGRLDIFPADDVGSQNKLMRWFGLKERPDYDSMHRILDRWSPYRGLLYFHLLLDHQAREGFL